MYKYLKGNLDKSMDHLMRPGRQSSLIFTNSITCTCGIKNNHRCLRLIGLETIKNSSLNNVMIHLKQGQT